LGGPEARAALETRLSDRGELVRAAVVSALAACGAEQSVVKAKADKSWRVRLEVARALARYPTRRGAALARELIDDPSSMVRSQTVASLAEWPVQHAGPVLLAAMGQTAYRTREAAAEQLALLWPPAAEFPVDGPPERRADALHELERLFREQVGFVDPEVLAAAAVGPPAVSLAPERIADAERLVRDLSDPGVPEPVRRRSVAMLRGFGPGLVGALGQLALDRGQTLPEAVYREVLPDCDPAFEVLNRLASRDVSVRRRAAEELVGLTRTRPLGRLAVARLASSAVTETDQLVWQNVLTAIADDPSEPASRLAYVAIGHPSPEVRRRACEYLAAHCGQNQQHVKVLLPALGDESDLVVRAAVRALGASGRMDDTQPLRQLLLARNELVRLEAATALCRLGDPSGPPGLERLSQSADRAVRRQVAVAMGEIGDPTFVASLIRLLEDHHSVRLAAMKALPEVVGYDVAEAASPPVSTFAERLELWRQWFQRQDNAPAPLEPHPGPHARDQGRMP